MDAAKTDRTVSDPAWRRWSLFIALLVLGGCYIAAYAFFLLHSKNFIDVARNQQAADFSRVHPLAGPTKIIFGRSETSNAYLGGGWHVPDPGGAWSTTKDAWVLLTVRKPDGDLSLRINAMPFLGTSHVRSTLHAYVNDSLLGTWTRSRENATEPLDIRIPHELAANGTLAIRLNTNYLDSPFRLRKGPDDRRLGLFLSSIEVR
jgi:hypothetical protein